MSMSVLPIENIRTAPWNPNGMDTAMRARLRRSIDRFGLVVPLVVRPLGADAYETIGGAQRLLVLREMGCETVSCVVVAADDTEARLLAQALNRIIGEEDLGLRAALVKDLLTRLPIGDILALLPETAESLKALASVGTETLAAHLEAWQRAQTARLRHLTFQVTPDQGEVVEEALARFLPEASAGEEGNPNRRGLALSRLCTAYLDLAGRLL